MAWGLLLSAARPDSGPRPQRGEFEGDDRCGDKSVGHAHKRAIRGQVCALCVGSSAVRVRILRSDRRRGRPPNFDGGRGSVAGECSTRTCTATAAQPGEQGREASHLQAAVQSAAVAIRSPVRAMPSQAAR